MINDLCLQSDLLTPFVFPQLSNKGCILYNFKNVRDIQLVSSNEPMKYSLWNNNEVKYIDNTGIELHVQRVTRDVFFIIVTHQYTIKIWIKKVPRWNWMSHEYITSLFLLSVICSQFNICQYQVLFQWFTGTLDGFTGTLPIKMVL